VRRCGVTVVGLDIPQAAKFGGQEDLFAVKSDNRVKPLPAPSAAVSAAVIDRRYRVG
jgi:hypothetical protein